MDKLDAERLLDAVNVEAHPQPYRGTHGTQGTQGGTWGFRLLCGGCLAAVVAAELLIAFGRPWLGMALSLAALVSVQVAATVVPSDERPWVLALAFAPLVRLTSAGLLPAAGPAAGFQTAAAGVALLPVLAAAVRAILNISRSAMAAQVGIDTARGQMLVGLQLLIAVAGIGHTMVGGTAVPGLDGFAAVALLVLLIQREFVVALGPSYRPLARELLYAVVPLLVMLVAVVVSHIAAEF
jgi:hypothetical protein